MRLPRKIKKRLKAYGLEKVGSRWGFSRLSCVQHGINTEVFSVHKAPQIKLDAVASMNMDFMWIAEDK